jgi:hypothetical protein
VAHLSDPLAEQRVVSVAAARSVGLYGMSSHRSTGRSRRRSSCSASATWASATSGSASPPWATCSGGRGSFVAINEVTLDLKQGHLELAGVGVSAG